MCSLPNETTRRGGKTSNIGFIPDVPPQIKESKKGVTPDNVQDQTAFPADLPEKAVWFLMRAAYGKEQTAKEILEADGIEVFLPTTLRSHLINGKNKVRKESLIPNFLFVHSTQAIMRRYIGQPSLEFFHHYYVPNKDENGLPIGKKGIKPLVIPDDQMNSFRKWHDVDDDNKLFLPEGKIDLQAGDKVKIIDGKFAGISGSICRVKKQSRVGVHIKGLGTIVTAFIPKAFLRKTDESSD